MIGILDVGGGMRGAYTAGIYDYLLKREIHFEYCLGVSAGAANMVSYLAGQQGRNFEFYADYSFRRKYMSLWNYFFRHNALNLNYIYSTLCNSDGENPVDFEALNRSTSWYQAVATVAKTGEAHYFTKADMTQDNYEILKASCCLPAVCRPVKIGGVAYYDGGVVEPIPYKKAFEDGCDKLVVLLTLPVEEKKERQVLQYFFCLKLWRYPKIYQSLMEDYKRYNTAVGELKVLEAQGKVKIIAPASTCGISTIKKSREGFQQLYDLGYKDGERIEAFLRQASQESLVG